MFVFLPGAPQCAEKTMFIWTRPGFRKFYSWSSLKKCLKVCFKTLHANSSAPKYKNSSDVLCRRVSPKHSVQTPQSGVTVKLCPVDREQKRWDQKNILTSFQHVLNMMIKCDFQMCRVCVEICTFSASPGATEEQQKCRQYWKKWKTTVKKQVMNRGQGRLQACLEKDLVS